MQLHAASEVGVGLAMGAAASTVSLAFGAPWDALIASLIAAILISIWLPVIDNKKKAAASVLFAALSGTYASPVVANLVAENIFNPSDFDSLRVLIAVVIAALSPTIVPVLIALARKKTEDTL